MKPHHLILALVLLIGLAACSILHPAGDPVIIAYAQQTFQAITAAAATNTPWPTYTPTVTSIGPSGLAAPDHALEATRIYSVGAPCVPTDTPRHQARVMRVLDGDSADMEIDGQVFTVRYLGVDSPKPEEPFGAEAQQRNQALISYQKVTLVQAGPDVDETNRLARYVFVGSTFINQQLIASGYARVAHEAGLTCEEPFIAAEASAQMNLFGIWGLPTPTP